MRFFIIFSLLLVGCGNNTFIITHPKLEPSVVVHPNFEGYALTLKCKWDIISK
jgi:hypothetical protein